MREWMQNAVLSYSPSPARMRPCASSASRLEAVTSLQCSPYALSRKRCPSGSITLKWLQTPSCRSRRTARRKAAARSTRAARSSVVAFSSPRLPMERDYSGAMKWRPLLLALLLAACSRITQENYQKIEDDMTEQQVVAILGKPTESNSMSVLGVSGTASRWVGNEGVITVRFVNG